jgi:hypothetical protein
MAGTSPAMTNFDSVQAGMIRNRNCSKINLP